MLEHGDLTAAHDHTTAADIAVDSMLDKGEFCCKSRRAAAKKRDSGTGEGNCSTNPGGKTQSADPAEEDSK